MQPARDRQRQTLSRRFVGKERLFRMQPARTALDAGAILATGTDWSSLPQDPWPLIEGMVHRRNPWLPAGESEANNAAEGVTIEESIYIYTMGGAHAMLAEDRLGSIEEGKYADFLVLDRNLLEIPVDDVNETDVRRTVFNGRVVYEKRTDKEIEHDEDAPGSPLSPVGADDL